MGVLTKKQQQQRRQKREQEAAAVAKLARQLGRDPKTGKPAVSRKQEKDLQVNYRDSGVRIYASGDKLAAPERDDTHVFQAEGWEEREALAQQETERKKKRIAPLYSKGPYQYLTDEADPTTLGRKV